MKRDEEILMESIDMQLEAYRDSELRKQGIAHPMAREAVKEIVDFVEGLAFSLIKDDESYRTNMPSGFFSPKDLRLVFRIADRDSNGKLTRYDLKRASLEMICNYLTVLNLKDCISDPVFFIFTRCHLRLNSAIEYLWQNFDTFKQYKSIRQLYDPVIMDDSLPDYIPDTDEDQNFGVA
jgi:hypothetical protein